MTKKKQKKVVKEEPKPCGCVLTYYSDSDKPALTPCPPCGFMEAGNALSDAARALRAVACALRDEQKKLAMMQVAQAAAARGPKKCE